MGQDNVATAHGPACLAPRQKSQNYKTNSGNSFELSLFSFEEQAKRGQGRGLTRADFAKRHTATIERALARKLLRR